MFCPHCGATISERARFCGSCGRSVAAAEVPPGGASGGPIPPAQQPFGSPPDFGPPPPFVPPATVQVKTGEWISEGWNVVKNDMGGMVLITLVFMLVNGVIPLVLTGPTMIGLYMYCSKRLLGRPAELGDLFKGFSWFVPSLVAMLLIGLLVNVGMLLCIIPGLVVMAMYMFAYHFIFDKGLDFWPAMQASHEVVKKNYFGFTMFIVVLGLLNLAGVLLCLVGVFFTMPITYVAISAAYRDNVGFDPSLRWTQQ